jgi:hypothetical protein
MAERDQEFVDYIVKTLVDNPDKVETSRTIDERGVLIELKVDPADMGKIIGKEGKTAKSIRTLLRVVGAKNDARVNLKIVEPEGSERPAPVQEESPVIEVTAEVAPEAPVEEPKEASSIDDIKL